jgi:tetratricopeptide (TPR) repeat protein
LEDHERWSDVIDLIRRQIEVSDDEGERLTAMINAGGICESYLADSSEAVEFYRMAYALDPQTPEVFDRLEACITRQGDMVELSRLLEERLQVIYDSDTLVRTYDSLVQLYAGDLDEPQRAIEALEKRIEQLSDDTAVDRLHDLYAEHSEWHRLVDSLNEHISDSDSDRRAKLLDRLIAVSESELGDSEQTRLACERSLELGHRTEEIVERLTRLMRAQGDWDELITVYEDELERTDDLGAACRLRQALVEIYLNQRENVDAASAHLEFVVEHEDSSSSRRLLAQLKSRQGHTDESLLLLNGLVESADVSDEDMALIQRDLGCLMLEPGDDAEAAIGAFEESFSLNGDIETLRLIVNAARQLEDVERLINALDSAVAFFEDAERLSTLRELSALRLEHGQIEEAVPVLEEIITELPDDVGVIKQLISALESLGRTAELTRRYEGWVNEFGTKRMSGLTAEISFKLACVYRDVGDIDKAVSLFESVTRLDSSNVSNLLALGDALSEQERWDETARTLSTAVLYQDQMNDSDRLSLFKLLGRAREELGETDKATQMYRRALALSPKDDIVKKRLERLREV